LGGKNLTVELSGLNANTPYNFRWHHYEQANDAESNSLILYKDSVAPENKLFDSGPYDKTTQNYFTDFAATTDGLGEITFVTGGSGQNMLNGFEVVSIVPEPATLALLGLGGAVMLSGRKRRHA
jgi:hypothetical protein